MAAPLSFFARPPPLGDTRTPATTTTAAAPKRVSSTIVTTMRPAKRLKPLDNRPSLETKAAIIHHHHHHHHRRALTPDPSSDPASDDLHPGHTHPAMHRIRAPPTPSTSTVAASSSPGRRFAMSSPRKPYKKHREFAPAVPVLLDSRTTLVFGRHRRQQAGLAPPPALLAPRLQNAANLARTVGLDRAARHASRVHAAAELVETQWGAIVRLVVLGQNGVRVRHGLGPHCRIRAGTVTEFAADEALEVDFYGAAVKICTEHERAPATPPPAPQHQQQPQAERLFTPEPVPFAGSAESPMSLPPSSPPVLMDSMHMDTDDDALSEMDEPHAEPEAVLAAAAPVTTAPTPAAHDLFSRASSPLSEPEDETPAPMVAGVVTPAPPPVVPGLAPTPNLHSERPSAPRASPTPIVAASQALAAAVSSRQTTPRPPKSRAQTPAVEHPPFPAALDLPALLATTVVFSGSSKLSLPDLVRALLESQPALRDHGDETRWSYWAAAELDVNPMFGKVARNGKDASGRPLLAHYFYNPAADPDTARAKELGGLVRPLRAAQRTGGKNIDWRPVGSGRRRYHY